MLKLVFKCNRLSHKKDLSEFIMLLININTYSFYRNLGNICLTTVCVVHAVTDPSDVLLMAFITTKLKADNLCFVIIKIE